MNPTPAGKMLREAATIVDGNRNDTHGDKERSFEAIAHIWSAYLATRKNATNDLRPVDVAHMMVLMKMMRTQWGDSIPDHWVDMAGYAAIAGELALP